MPDDSPAAVGSVVCIPDGAEVGLPAPAPAPEGVTASVISERTGPSGTPDALVRQRNPRVTGARPHPLRQ